MTVKRPRIILGSALAVMLSAMTAAVAAAQSTVSGTVTESGSHAPLVDARVTIVGTSLVATSGPDGKYVIRGLPIGAAEVRVNRVGYAEQKKPVQVTAGQTVTVDFEMAKTVVQLQEVVTTATGEQRRVEIGNTVENVGVSNLAQTAPVPNVADVLNSRVAGVMVESGGQTGSGQRIRIRGVSSVSLDNDPIYIIDGVRMTSNNNSATFGNGGSNFSRLGDIDPQQIENIEIVKGPSAATLYGTDAANGVIVITTKQGRAGAARWNVYAEGGILDDMHTYPENYTLAGHSPAGTPLITAGRCTLVKVAAGDCVEDSLRVYTPINDPNATPLGLGNRQAAGLQVSGGTSQLRYFLSADRDNEIGVFKLPAFEQARYDSMGVTPHDWTERPNARLSNNFRSNFSAQINDKLDATVNFGYTTVDMRTSNESNNTVGIGSQAFGGPGYENNGTVSQVGTPLFGYRAWTPAYTWEERLGQTVNRSILSSNLNYRPFTWLQTRANVGEDFTDRVDSRLHMNGEAAPITSTYRDGFAGNGRTNITTLTADLGATANYNPGRYPWLSFKTTVGAQYNNYRLDQNEASGTTLPPGATTASAGATNGASEGTDLNKTLGLYLDEVAGIRDRLYLDAAVRTDQNSAFGTKFQRVYYPKFSVSYVMSDEDWFPRGGPIFSHVSSFRPRFAYGASGVQPGSNTALQTYDAGSASIAGTDLPYEVYSTVGNDSLRPERSAEFEGGFDAGLFSKRLDLEVTYYSKTTHDALIAAIVAPSVGISATRQEQNLGSIKNAGLEVTLGGQLVDNRALGIDFHLATSLNANKVVSLGNTATQVGTTNWVAAGYPIRGLFARPIEWYKDRNGDGILTYNADSALTEVYVGKDTIFRGYAEPRYMTSFTSGVELFHRLLRIQNLFDWRGGNKWYNNNERIRCVSRQNCNGLNNPAASFAEQAMVVADLNDPSHTLDGYLQPGAFVKWREISATLTLPSALASRIRAQSANVSFSARNLHTWTHYRGIDPEGDFAAGNGGDSPSEFESFAAPSYFILRLNLGF